MTESPDASEDAGAARPRVAVAGASGFIGTALLPRLAGAYQVTALTRSPARAAAASELAGVSWRHCDLFSAPDVEAALAGVDLAVYLVHSLAPSSRLTQARPRDLDLVLADNFARAAAVQGLRHIVFVSGVMPRSFRFSPLLWNRREVEMVLGSRGTPVTSLRASLVVGPGGTGPGLMVDLVRRLPLLLLPPPAASRTRPIALPDLVRAIVHCLDRPEAFAGPHDVGGPEALSYEEMLRRTARVLGLRRAFVHVPVLPTSLAALTARLVSRAPAPMVGAVVESLPQDTVMRDNDLQRAIAPGALGFQAALESSVDASTRRLLPNPRRRIRDRDDHLMRDQSLVRSVQRVILPPGQDAAWVAGNYFRWVGRCCWPLVMTRVAEDESVEVWVRFPGLKLLTLELDPEHSGDERRVYAITGGLLARGLSSGRPRFEFQTLLDGRYTMTAIHDYAPALPWWLYSVTQAVVHRLVMRWYQSKLARLAR